MNPFDTDPEAYAHPAVAYFMKRPVAILTIIAGIALVWVVASWWTDWRWRRK